MKLNLHPEMPNSAGNARFVKRVCVVVVLMVFVLTSCVYLPMAPKTPLAQTGQPTPLAIAATSVTGVIEPSQHLQASAVPSDTIEPSPVLPSETPPPSPSPTSAVPVVFAVIGDYGTGDRHEADVAHLILEWQPDFVITLGDNNYPSGLADHMDVAVGQYFHSFIFPYLGSFGMGSDINRFFPCLGNHDVITDRGKPYFDYFTLPGNERYYDFTWGPVHLFALDDLETEPDGVGVSSAQAEWLKAGLAASTSPWKIVYMHYPPYSSGTHGSTDWARWPYAEWGADAVMAGHDHTYERLEVGGLAYFVNGLGGGGRYEFKDIVDGSLVRYNSDYGAMRVEATNTSLVFEFMTTAGEVVDQYDLRK
jgi:tartrate-resistant acid phosphatase type 5